MHIPTTENDYNAWLEQYPTPKSQLMWAYENTISTDDLKKMYDRPLLLKQLLQYNIINKQDFNKTLSKNYHYFIQLFSLSNLQDAQQLSDDIETSSFSKQERFLWNTICVFNQHPIALHFIMLINYNIKFFDFDNNDVKDPEHGVWWYNEKNRQYNIELANTEHHDGPLLRLRLLRKLIPSPWFILHEDLDVLLTVKTLWDKETLWPLEALTNLKSDDIELLKRLISIGWDVNKTWLRYFPLRYFDSILLSQEEKLCMEVNPDITIATMYNSQTHCQEFIL